MKRAKMSRKASNKAFHKGQHTHVRNMKPMPMRGGYRF